MTVDLFAIFSRCNVLVLSDLWYFGNPSRNMAPYRMHKSSDYENHKDASYLSRARKVLEKIESLVQDSEGPDFKFSNLTINESRIKFAVGFDKLCIWLSPNLSQEEIDRKHYGSAMFLSFYDRINKRKRDD